MPFVPTWVEDMMNRLEEVGFIRPTLSSDFDVPVLQLGTTSVLCYSLQQPLVQPPQVVNLPLGQRIHLWEDIWQRQQNLVLSRLRHRLGQSVRLPARVMQAKRLDKTLANSFLQTHHLGGSPAMKHAFGLFLPPAYFRLLPLHWQPALPSEPWLLAVASFAAPRQFKQGILQGKSAELIRVATHQSVAVVGGFEKLLAIYKQEQQPDNLMTYADADWSDGTFYEQRGFVAEGATLPQAFWVNTQTFERHAALRFTPPTAENWLLVQNRGSIKYRLFY